MKRDYQITFLTEFLVLVSQIVVFKLAANFLGNQGFGEYALARRTISFAIPVLLLGMGVGLTRYLAFATADSTKSESSNPYYVCAFLIVTTAVSLFLAALNLLAREGAYLFFGDKGYHFLILPLSLSILGICFHTLAYSYYRGHLRMLPANCLQFINLGLIPLGVFALPEISVSRLFTIMGLLWIGTSGMVILHILKKIPWKNFSFNQLKDRSKELLSYGLVRLPGDFGMAALLTLPATLTAHISGIEKARYVAFGISILNLLGTMFTPVGLVLLPKASKMVAKKEFPLLKKHLLKLLKVSLGVTAIAVVVFELFAPDIIRLYLGEGFEGAVNILRVILIGALPHTAYIVLRSSLDAVYVRPKNVKNILLALTFFLLVSLGSGSSAYVIFSLCGGLFILGAFTVYDIHKGLAKQIQI